MIARTGRANPGRAVTILLLLVGSAARLIPLTANRFHPDEALFSTLARLIAGGQDPILAHTPLLVDKPPLFYYTLALSVISMGGREIALRMPGLLMSIISMALTARLCWRLWRSWLAVTVATAIVGLSPFTILFSPTVFSDPQYVFWLLFSMVAIAERRWGWAGLLSGLALASKQSAAFFLPLVVLIGLVQAATLDGGAGRPARRFLRYLAGFCLVMLLVVIWDQARSPAASFWVAALDVNNPGRLIRSAEVWPRASAWLSWASAFTGSPVSDVVLIVLTVSAAPLDMIIHPKSRPASATVLISAALLAYLAVIWFVAFPLLDRYLLPAIYLVALLAGRGADLVVGILKDRLKMRRIHSALAPAVVAGLLVVFLPGTLRAAQSGFPVGGDHGAYAGIDQMAEYISTRPMGTVVYSHDLNWPLDFYLFDAYVYRAYFQGPAPLESDLRAFGGSHDERYIMLSEAESALEIGQAVEGAGYRLTPIDVGIRTGLKLYRLDHIR